MIVRVLRYIIFFIFSLLSIEVYSLPNDSIINIYTDALKVLNSNNLDPDSVIVSNPAGFHVNDTIIIHQAKGCSWNPNNGFNGAGLYFAGHFDFHIIHKIINDTIIFQGALPSSGSYIYDATQNVQIVRVPSLVTLKVNNKLSCANWDGKKGGILAVIADTIVMNANIDVTGKGYRGADPGSIFSTTSALCLRTDSANIGKPNFAFNAQDTAGLKGESPVVFDSANIRGRISYLSGGGGGNGYRSGGGGGANFGSGGRGGDEADNCAISIYASGNGGYSLSGNILNSSVSTAVFGGGGGGSTQDASMWASKGGNGGGLVILMVSIIISNNDTIKANGQNVTDICTSGAGGGGGGGAILIDAAKYNGNLILQAKGGKGGYTNNINNSGPGGGGGGGYIRLSTKSPLPKSIDVASGSAGFAHSGSRNALAGSAGSTYKNLLMPVYDFLFNFMPSNQDICSGDIPKTLIASVPKGGSGTYQYTWLQSSDKKNWNAVGSDSSYSPLALTDTTFYRRIVKSIYNSVTITDTSAVLTINVLPKIQNNSIYTDTTVVCKGSLLPVIHQIKLNGGNGSYKYLWQDSISSPWNSAQD